MTTLPSTLLPASQRASAIWSEFKAFAFKGNVIDLAVGVIIGAAFGKIVDSLVKHIIMPLVNLVVPGEASYAAWKLDIGGKELPYGLFIAEVLNFLIVAFVLFLFIRKFLGWMMKARHREAAGIEPAPPPLSKDQQLLSEIRDLLRAGSAARVIRGE